jgi:hypothetical protein
MNNRFAALSEDYTPAPRTTKVVQKPRAAETKVAQRAPENIYSVAPNGNVYNTNTFYVTSGAAHADQVKKLFEKAVYDASEIMNRQLDCDVKVNLVINNGGVYLTYAYVDLDGEDAKYVYWMLREYNPDGSPRVDYVEDPEWDGSPSDRYELIDDPNWTQSTKSDEAEGLSWGDEVESLSPTPTKIKRYLPPLIKVQLPPLIELESYDYDEEQIKHFAANLPPGEVIKTYGEIRIAPAYITPGATPDKDNRTLFVKNVPTNDVNFLRKLFKRYARTYNQYVDYPTIEINRCRTSGEQGSQFSARIKFGYPNDAAFALLMLRKINVVFDGRPVTMIADYAWKDNRHRSYNK